MVSMGMREILDAIAESESDRGYYGERYDYHREHVDWYNSRKEEDYEQEG